MTRLLCPNVVAAGVRLAEYQKQAEGKGLWALADALIKDCGGEDNDTPVGTPTGRSGRHNGSTATIAQASTELGNNGVEFTKETLRQIRDIGIAFPRAER